MTDKSKPRTQQASRDSPLIALRDAAFHRACRRAAHALSGTCPDGNDCPPDINAVLADLVFEITGDIGYAPQYRGGGGGC